MIKIIKFYTESLFESQDIQKDLYEKRLQLAMKWCFGPIFFYVESDNCTHIWLATIPQAIHWFLILDIEGHFVYIQ